MRRSRVEVARATEGTVAVLDPVALKTPFSLRHVIPPFRSKVHLSHWGAFDRQAGHLPFRKAILEPSHLIAPASQQCDRLEGKDAPGTAAVSDDLAIQGKLRQPELQLRQRNIECAR